MTKTQNAKSTNLLASAASAGQSTAAPPAPTKRETVLTLLARSDGASLDELVAATGWLPHTTRAMLTGLKKKGHALTSDKTDGVRRYRIGAGVA